MPDNERNERAENAGYFPPATPGENSSRQRELFTMLQLLPMLQKIEARLTELRGRLNQARSDAELWEKRHNEQTLSCAKLGRERDEARAELLATREVLEACEAALFQAGMKLIELREERDARKVWTAMGCGKAESFEGLLIEYAIWVDHTFPGETVKQKTEHLAEEFYELANGEFAEPGEFADVFMLLFDVARTRGINLLQAFREKFTVNQQRTWKKTEKGFRHVK